MKNLKNRKWTLAKRPIGMVGEHNFSFEEEEVRDIQEGEFLIKTCISALILRKEDGWKIEKVMFLQLE